MLFSFKDSQVVARVVQDYGDPVFEQLLVLLRVGAARGAGQQQRRHALQPEHLRAQLQEPRRVQGQRLE